MKGDFSRLTFRPDKHYSAVVSQQGRVQLDADTNEQSAIQRQLARTFAVDVIGRAAGTLSALRIDYVSRVGSEPASLKIHGGRYYVDGILVDSTRLPPREPVPQGEPLEPQSYENSWTYWNQPWGYRDPERESHVLPEVPFVVYLKTWERLVTAIEDPEIRESALGAALPDTTARVQVVWQVLPTRAGDGLDISHAETAQEVRDAFRRWADQRAFPASRLAARTKRPAQIDDDPCITSPESRYRGPENQLYRVEVHQGGSAGAATIKWSRDNGSVAFPISSLNGTQVTVGALGRDDKLDLHVGDWVEVADDAYSALAEPAPLLQVEEVDWPGRRVRLSGEPRPDVGRNLARHPLLRRWDHRTPADRTGPQLDHGAVKIAEGDWLDLEDGVQVWFKPGGSYRTGDYWLIPARTLTGDVEWRRDRAGVPLLAPPDGVAYHYAPLAWVCGATDVQDLRTILPTLGIPVENTGSTR